MLFEWVHMETVFDCAIEHVALDETHHLLVITGLGRSALFQVFPDNSGR